MSMRFRLRTFCIAITLLCLVGIFVWEFRSLSENTRQMELIGAKIYYSKGELWLLGEWTPRFARNLVRRPIGIDLNSDIGSTREILTRLARIRTIERLSLSLNSSSSDSPLDFPSLPKLKEFYLKSGGNIKLGRLKDCPELRILEIDYCDGCTDSFLETIPSLPKLRYFEIDMNGVTNDGLSVLAKMTSLSELCIANLESIETLRNLPKVPTLRRFNLRTWVGVESNVLGSLEAFPNLEDLIFETGPIEGTLKHLPKLDCLRRLHVENAIIGGDDIRSLRQLKNLVELRFGGVKFCEDSFDKVPILRNLEDLEFAYCELPLNCLSQIGPMKSLRRLTISFNGVSNNLEGSRDYADELLNQLPPLSELLELHIGAGVSAVGLGQVKKFPKLETLELGIDRFPDEFTIELPQFESIVSLSFRGSFFETSGLRVLSHFPNLRDLDLSGTGTEDSWDDLFLRSLPPLEKLTALNLSGTRISRETLLVLPNLKNLERLELAYCQRLASNPQDWVASLERLKELNLDCVELDSFKLDGLSNSPSLQVLSLMESKVALEELPFVPTLRVVRINSKKQPISETFSFPRLPDGLRLETSEGLFSEDEKDILYKKYRNVTIVELDLSSWKEKDTEWTPVYGIKAWPKLDGRLLP